MKANWEVRLLIILERGYTISLDMTNIQLFYSEKNMNSNKVGRVAIAMLLSIVLCIVFSVVLLDRFSVRSSCKYIGEYYRICQGRDVKRLEKREINSSDNFFRSEFQEGSEVTLSNGLKLKLHKFLSYFFEGKELLLLVDSEDGESLLHLEYRDDLLHPVAFRANMQLIDITDTVGFRFSLFQLFFLLLFYGVIFLVTFLFVKRLPS